MWGWATYLLPYLEQGTLYQSIRQDLLISDPANRPAVTTVLPLYVCPSDRDSGIYIMVDSSMNRVADLATNSYAACYGSQGLLVQQPDLGTGVFYRNSRTRYQDILDGTSQTIAIGERATILAQTPWAGPISQGIVQTTAGAPVFQSVVLTSPAAVMARIARRQLNDAYSEPYDFFSAHPNVVHFLFADGSVHGLAIDTPLPVLQALATRAAEDIPDGW
jgi:prepilin-type processing-associated H-X9-DG protein